MKLIQNCFNQVRVNMVSFNQLEAERKLVATVAFDLISLLQILITFTAISVLLFGN